MHSFFTRDCRMLSLQVSLGCWHRWHCDTPTLQTLDVSSWELRRQSRSEDSRKNLWSVTDLVSLFLWCFKLGVLHWFSKSNFDICSTISKGKLFIFYNLFGFILNHDWIRLNWNREIYKLLHNVIKSRNTLNDARFIFAYLSGVPD